MGPVHQSTCHCLSLVGELEYNKPHQKKQLVDRKYFVGSTVKPADVEIAKKSLRGYDVGMLPPLFTCYFCRKELSPNASDTMRRVSGWTDGKGGSRTQTIVLSHEMLLYAHRVCVTAERDGGTQKATQDQLF